MIQYTGTKIIKAEPMSRLEYNQYRGWELPSDENGEDEGYIVEYIDGGQSNHSNHEGYISWSPRDVFEKAYKPSETPLERMVIEEEELGKKIHSLSSALNKDGFDKVVGSYQFDLMSIQLASMTTYRQILRLRIKDMKKKDLVK